MWRANLDRIPTLVALTRRNILFGDNICSMCGDTEESTDHIFTACIIANGVWDAICTWCNIPKGFLFSFQDIIEMANRVDGSRVRKQVVYGVIVLTCWCIWKARNEKRFNNVEIKVPKIVTDVKSLGYLWYRNRFNGGKVDWKGWNLFCIDIV
ncbi:reverse transcriptase domain, Reverse transcriptase zinc-binding domain protein [Artemisia annua]|uniref:Reverse transcriptase domain, Reverse transcriptase zinc-binding domain protein n=1 Tax=Artemisia annua TaxID=35608 RepID=A0A2U1M3H8_ARTAN|nr:reverse transcriptase domain, Reverse transcriptase zinc-binding domain protein [Artemisia annua]